MKKMIHHGDTETRRKWLGKKTVQWLVFSSVFASGCRGCDEGAKAQRDAGVTVGDAERYALVDRFEAPGVDTAKWAFVREGDMREAAVATRGGKLWLEMETVGATPGTMKTVGVRTAKAIDVGRGVVIEMTLNWDALSLKALARAGVAVSTDGSGRGRGGRRDAGGQSESSISRSTSIRSSLR